MKRFDLGNGLCPILLLLAAIAAGCASRDRTPDDEIVFAIGANPTNLDPRYGTDAWSDKIGRLLFRSLLRRDEAGATSLDLAASVARPDDRTVAVHLAPDVRFHDGSPLTAEDVAWTYRYVLDERNKSIKRAALSALDRVEVAGPLDVTFHLKEPFAPFLESLTLGIVPRKVAESLGDGYAGVLTGSGPYRFVSYRKDEAVVLEAAFPGEPGGPRVPRLRFRIVPDATVRVLELLHGSADLTQNDLPAHLVEYLSRRGDLSVESAIGNLVKYMVFNVEDPLLADPRVRKALTRAIDRDEIVRYEIRGFATPAASILPPSHWAYAKDLPVQTPDLDEARRLLDEAGYPDPDGDGPKPRLRLTYRTSLDDVAVAVAGIVQLQLARIGVDVRLETSEFGVFLSDIKQGRFQLYTITAVGVSDPDWYGYVLHSGSIPPNGANRGRYRDPAMDELLDRGKRTIDPVERAAIYADVQRLCLRDLPIWPLWYEHNVRVARPDLQGYRLTPFGDLTSLPDVRKVRP